MRTILREVGQNGAQAQDRLELGDDPVTDAPESVPAPPPAHQVREVKRDRALAHMAGLILDVSRTVEPLVELISARLLRWAALGASVALAFSALRGMTGPWESAPWGRVVVLAVFMLLVPWLLRKTP